MVIEEISNYGMRDYFRDEFIGIDDSSGSGRIIGGWDIHNSQYVISTRKNVNSNDTSYNTVVFDESVLGWTSFFTYAPDALLSLRNNFYSVKNNKLYKHYSSEVNRGNFYGEDNNTSITFIFNPNVSMVKNFNTVNYEGGSGFEITSFKSGFTGQDQFNSNYSSVQDIANVVKSYEGGEYAINSNGVVIPRANYGNSPQDPNNPGFGTTNPPTNRYYAGFVRRENKYVANIVNSSAVIPGEVRFGAQVTGIKGYFATVTISTDMEINQTTKQAMIKRIVCSII
jgi:hypothetical protein